MSKPTFVPFPKDFLWGTATSSFQVEGSPLADGAGKSDWYQWTHTPGRIANGDDADLACDHYRRYKQDVALMKGLGLKAYRFSISWSRIMPEKGVVNTKGLDFYRALIDEIRAAGIVPFATLYHWETPLWVKGGWENRETVRAFEDYAKVVFKELGPKVPYWATQNEPLVVASLGYLWGVFPPGKQDKTSFGKAVHHLNLAHGLAVRAFRELAPHGEIGLVQALGTCDPVTERPEDIAHAEFLDVLNNRSFLDPITGRGYDPRFFQFTGKWEFPLEEDLKTIQQPVDFIGVNHYFRSRVRYKKGANILDNDGALPPGTPVGDMDYIWEVRPRSFADILRYVWKNYGFKKIYVTENGIATRRSLRSQEDLIQDDVRIHFLGTYLAEAAKLIKEGLPLKGYFAWSLMDNFEWAQGYDPMFGLVAVDFKTQERTLKKSALWYKRVIAENGFDLSELPVDPPYLRVPELLADAR
jgi:beta-glucosidase